MVLAVQAGEEITLAVVDSNQQIIGKVTLALVGVSTPQTQDVLVAQPDLRREQKQAQASETKPKGRKQASAEARQKMADAQRRRWAKYRQAKGSSAAK